MTCGKIALILALSGLFAAAGMSTVNGADPFPGELPGTDFSAMLPPGFEPSGATWHPRLGKLLVVDDGGQVVAMNLDGSITNSWSLPGDLEGICLAQPEEDWVYVGDENAPRVRELNLVTGEERRTFRLFDPIPGNAGLEALTFVPVAGHPEGGMFYAGLQSDGTVHVFDLPIISSTTSTEVTLLSSFSPIPGQADLSGLHFDHSSRLLFAIYDSANLLVQMKADGKVLAQWNLPGQAQEGVAVAGCDLVIAQDSGQLMRYAFFPDGGDADGDGVSDCEDNCVDEPNLGQVNTDGDGLGDVCDDDDDDDWVADSADNCPLTINPGQVDLDGDGAGDLCDDDDDDDGVGDLADNCPLAANANQDDTDGDGAGDVCDDDDDDDGLADGADNCPLVANLDQGDLDGDGAGDPCDDDDDADGVDDLPDNCPLVANPDQADADTDGKGDACDVCPDDPLDDADGDAVCDGSDNCPGQFNPEQADLDLDGQGDPCDADDDEDGVDDLGDNCARVVNPDQLDADSDGAGDACDCAAGDPSVWSLPAEVAGLSLEHDSTAGETTLFWGSEDGIFDVVRGVVSELAASSGVADALCLGNDEIDIAFVDSQSDPPLQAGYYYLVRAANDCGTGTYGKTTLGDERTPIAACP